MNTIHGMIDNKRAKLFCPMPQYVPLLNRTHNEDTANSNKKINAMISKEELTISLDKPIKTIPVANERYAVAQAKLAKLLDEINLL